MAGALFEGPDPMAWPRSSHGQCIPETAEGCVSPAQLEVPEGQGARGQLQGSLQHLYHQGHALTKVHSQQGAGPPRGGKGTKRMVFTDADRAVYHLN